MGLKAIQLPRGATRIVGIGKMRHHGDFRHLRYRLQTFIGRPRIGQRKTQPIHAGIQFEENRKRLLQFCRSQHINLVLPMHDSGQSQRRKFL